MEGDSDKQEKKRPQGQSQSPDGGIHKTINNTFIGGQQVIGDNTTVINKDKSIVGNFVDSGNEDVASNTNNLFGKKNVVGTQNSSKLPNESNTVIPKDDLRKRVDDLLRVVGVMGVFGAIFALYIEFTKLAPAALLPAPPPAAIEIDTSPIPDAEVRLGSLPPQKGPAALFTNLPPRKFPISIKYGNWSTQTFIMAKSDQILRLRFGNDIPRHTIMASVLPKDARVFEKRVDGFVEIKERPIERVLPAGPRPWIVRLSHPHLDATHITNHFGQTPIETNMNFRLQHGVLELYTARKGSEAEILSFAHFQKADVPTNITYSIGNHWFTNQLNDPKSQIALKAGHRYVAKSESDFFEPYAQSFEFKDGETKEFEIPLALPHGNVFIEPDEFLKTVILSNRFFTTNITIGSTNRPGANITSGTYTLHRIYQSDPYTNITKKTVTVVAGNRLSIPKDRGLLGMHFVKTTNSNGRIVYVGKYPVTNREYDLALGLSPSTEHPSLPVTGKTSTELLSAFFRQLRKKLVNDRFELRLPNKAEWDEVGRPAYAAALRLEKEGKITESKSMNYKGISGLIDDKPELLRIDKHHGASVGSANTGGKLLEPTDNFHAPDMTEIRVFAFERE